MTSFVYYRNSSDIESESEAEEMKAAERTHRVRNKSGNLAESVYSVPS